MKFVVAVLCVIVTCISTQAQLSQPSIREQYAARVSPIRLRESGALHIQTGNLPGQHGMKVGKTLTIAGGVLLVGGIVLVSTADALYYNSTTTNGTTTEEGDIKGGLGVIMIAGGAGMVIPGVIIWSKSKKRYNQYLIDHPQQSLSMHATGLSYRF